MLLLPLLLLGLGLMLLMQNARRVPVQKRAARPPMTQAGRWDLGCCWIVLPLLLLGGEALCCWLLGLGLLLGLVLLTL